MSEGYFNRAARRSGGARPATLVVPPVTVVDAAIALQRERIRAEFGEAGVARYDALLLEHAQADAEAVSA